MINPIQIFTKPDCPYCKNGKAVLDEKDLAYDEHDVTADDRTADLSVYLSGVSTVPQIFVGSKHVNGSGDLEALSEHKRLLPLLYQANSPMDTESLEAGVLASGAKDYVLREAIPEHDGSRSGDERDWPILHMYKEFFGFWPNCFYYQYHWPEVAYRQFVYCHNVGAIGGGKKVLGAPVMNALGYATSNAHGCNYCQVHSASVGGEESVGYAKGIEMAREGDFSGEFGPFEAALADLVAKASTNTVTSDDVARAKGYAGEARFSKLPGDANIAAASMIAAAFGFLNVFNDLTGVKVEAGWAEKAEDGAGIETGRHGSSTERESSNLDYELPEGGPSMAHMVAHYAKDVVLAGGPQRYMKKHVGLKTSWVAEWPLPLRPNHVRFYVSVMTDEEADGVRIAPELKHLMARVSHVAKGNDYMAAVEGWLAWNAAGRSQGAVQRVRYVFDAATRFDDEADGGSSNADGDIVDDLFDDRERAALKLAWLSAQTPLTTPKRFVDPAIKHFNPTELVHLITVCSLASMLQRFTAIAMLEHEDEVLKFMRKHDLSLDTLEVRYPLEAQHA